jgi:hypothetical protein
LIQSEPSRSESPAPSAEQAGVNGLAVAALVLGVVGFVAFPLVPSILAIILGLRARRQIESGPARGRALAEAGIVLGWAAIALLVLSAAGLVAVFSVVKVG